MPRLIDPVVPRGRMASLGGQPSLSTERVVLRPWRPSDADAVIGAFSEEDIRRWHLSSLDRDEALAWLSAWEERWDAETDASWAIVTEPDEPARGYVGLRAINLDFGSAFVSYWVRGDSRRRGLASEGARLVATWAIEELGLHRIEVRHSVENRPSCLVAERAGFLAEGTAVGALRHADGWHDMHIHARVADR